MTCCEMLERVLQKDPHEKGLVAMPHLDLSKKVGDSSAVSTKPCYKDRKGQKANVFHVHFCPFCGKELSS